jgi:hypothetical protein
VYVRACRTESITVDELIAQLNYGDVRKRHLNGLLARAAVAVSPSLTRAMVDVLSADSLPDLPLVWEQLRLVPQSIATVWNGAVTA